MPTEIDAHREAAALLYDSAGREISLNFDTMNANLSLAAGALAAVLSVLGAGELFRAPKGQAVPKGLPHLSSVSLLVLALVFPLLMRFFVRTMLAYNNLLRYNRLQRAALAYLDGRAVYEWLDLEREWYLDRWRSPLGLWKLVWQNLEYGYLWILAVAGGTFSWAMITANDGHAELAASCILAVGICWEIMNLATSRRQFFTRPNEDVRCRLRDLKLAAAPHFDEPTLDVSSGVFIGRRRTMRS